MEHRPQILIVYTGGTIGMVEDAESGSLIPFDFESLLNFAPELKKISCDVDLSSFATPIDSSDMDVSDWQRIGEIIHNNYFNYDGFVVLHGTDTMSYTASALSFMLQNLGKPVILTGSQLPIGMSRTDARENLITSVEIAATMQGGLAKVPEVSLFFEDQLFRGNRTQKNNAEYFEAFSSANYPKLAEAGIRIRFHKEFIQKIPDEPLEFKPKMDNRVASIRVFPGISKEVFESVLATKDLKGLILETYGSGNAFTKGWFLDGIEKAMKSGIKVVNVTQCSAGSVDMGRYKTSSKLAELGVWSGFDLTFEAALTKLMHVLAYADEIENLKDAFESPISGELSHG